MLRIRGLFSFPAYWKGTSPSNVDVLDLHASEEKGGGGQINGEDKCVAVGQEEGQIR